MRYREGVAAARASYDADKRRSDATTDLPTFLVYRPLSFWVTPLFAAWGASPTAVTTIGLGGAVAMPLAACLGGAPGAVAVVFLAVAAQVLDCVDGNLARMTRASSEAGRLLDNLTMLVFWAAWFVAVGVLALRSAPGFVGRHGLEIGLGLAVLLLLQRELEDSYDAVFEERVRWGPYLPPAAAGWDLTSLGRVVEQAVAFGGLLVAAMLERLDVFLGLVAVYQGGLFVAWLPKFVIALRRRL